MAFVILLLLPLVSRAEPMTISGFTEPVLDSNLGLDVIGRVAKIHSEQGQTVEKGEPILELDQRVEQIGTARRKLIWNDRTEIDAVSRQLETLTIHLNDTKSLYQSTKAANSVPREELENQELEHDLANIDLKTLQIKEEREKLEYDIARQELRKRTLYAPFSGQIVEFLIGVGENIEPDTPLVQLVSTSPLNFVANVELGISQKLELGQSVELQLQAGAETVNREAEIVFISPVIDLASRLRTIKARFDNQDGAVVPGITGVMRLTAE
jgi:RND family efflux transporter MFP subunit